MDYLNLLDQLEKIVVETSEQILNQYFLHTHAEIKTDGSIVTEADLAMQQALTEQLKKFRPEVIMLGEEMSPEMQQEVIESGNPYWCLDPLDGTNNFHHGVPLFAISLALIEGRQVKAGIVYDPVRKECFSAATQRGLRINGLPYTPTQQPESLKQCLASIDFKRLKSQTKKKLFDSMPFKSQRNIGTCALEWAWLAAGRTQLLLHGGEKLWDYAAGSLLLEEAAGCSCTLERGAVFNGSLQPRSVVAASNHSLHQLWQAFLLD